MKLYPDIWVEGIGRKDGPPLPRGEVNLVTGQRRWKDFTRVGGWAYGHARHEELAKLRANYDQPVRKLDGFECQSPPKTDENVGVPSGGMTSRDELKPCPFCGRSGPTIVGYWPDMNGLNMRVRCTCGVAVGGGVDEGADRDMWNIRALADARGEV